MIDATYRYELRNRYRFKGKLVMQTPLHIGGGKATLSYSDSPVVLTPDRIPFIPGSSFKGALRSTVEKLVSGLSDVTGLRSCGLIELSEESLKEAKARSNNSDICPTIRQWDIQQRRRNATPKEEEEITKEIYESLCHTCELFGSPFAASRINVSDLYMPKKEWHGVLEVRDGVAIDRDSEKAKDRLKYDFEVVPASATFDLKITLENATDEDLQLICVGLSEFVHGFGFIGGKRSRGLGACRLEKLEIHSLRLDDKENRTERLRKYLLSGEKALQVEDSEAFLNKYINDIFGNKAEAR